MKRRNELFALAAIMTLSASVLSCKRNSRILMTAQTDCVDTIVIDTQNGLRTEREQAFDSIWTIRLETSDKCMIGNTDIILFMDSTIVVADLRIAKAVYMFGYDGHFKGQLSALGNGRNEYLYLSHVALDQRGRIAISDETKRRIMFFDENGNYCESSDCDMFATAMGFPDSNTVAFDISARYHSGDDMYSNVSFVVRDSEGQDLYSFGQTRFPGDLNFTRGQNMYTFSDKVWCNVNFDDVLYTLERTGPVARYVLDIRPDNASDHYPFKNKDELLDLWDNYSHFNGEFIELDDYSYVAVSVCDYTKELPQVIFKHKTGQSFSVQPYFNDPMMSFFTYPLTQYGGKWLVCPIPASQVLSNKMGYSEKIQTDSRLQSLYEGLEPDSNPVLFLFRVAL